MKKVNFTAEHRTQLEKAFVDLSFKGESLTGKFGAGTINPYDMLHNVSVQTLKSVHSQLKSEIAKKEADTDEWTNSEYDQQQLRLKKRWVDFIHLVIGYRRSEQEKAENAETLKAKKKELERLIKENKTPEQAMKELQDEIAALEGTPVETAPAPQA